MIISIHAPLRERRNCRIAIALFCYFNPRSLAGATISNKVTSSFIIRFQSTLPCGSDAYMVPVLDILTNFNPRSLAGATLTSLSMYIIQCISIHAPLRERRPVPRRAFWRFLISIHAPLRERHKYVETKMIKVKFQSTLPCGSDVALACAVHASRNFNPRSLAGATSIAIFWVSSSFYFNPRSLAGATGVRSNS